MWRIWCWCARRRGGGNWRSGPRWAPFTYGNSARNLLFGSGDIVFDLSVQKATKIMETVTVQFRADFFNLPNHPNLTNPAANISVPAQVGRIFGALDPRQIQFGLKVLF